MDSYVNSVIKADEFPIHFGIKAFDELFGGDLRGLLAAYIGYGGTKKSLFSLNNANLNASKNKTTTLYSNMEMSGINLLKRMIDYSTEPEFDKESSMLLRGTDFFKKEILKGYHEEIREVLKVELDKYYGDRLLMYNKPSASFNEILTMAEKTKPDILVVDGLSRMSGKGTETEKFTENTGLLKELVNDCDIYGIIICHCSRSVGGVAGTKTTRSASKYVRGSEQILSNVDFSISFSLCEEEADIYDPMYGWMRLEDKRGSGKVIDQIYQFDSMRLMMNDTNKDPRAFENFKSKY